MTRTVVIESRDIDTREVSRDVFELTPAPSPGDEHRVLVELVTGIHPSAVEVAYTDGVVYLDDGGRTITAAFAEGPPPPEGGEPPEQGTLFG